MNSQVEKSRLQAVCLMTQFLVKKKKKFRIYMFVYAKKSLEGYIVC